jgi:hypothetical protein
MDPFLEADWPSVHGPLITSCVAALNRVLPPDLAARSERGIRLNTDPGRRGDRSRPDASIFGDDRDGGGVATSTRPATARKTRYGTHLTRLALNRPRRRWWWRWLKIIEGKSQRIITSLEFLSPTNKRGGGANKFIHKRERLLRRGVHSVEIDLTRGGDWRSCLPEDFDPPDKADSTYRIFSFIYKPHVIEAWTTGIALLDPLPEITIPLRPDDPLVTLALQPLVERAYVEGRYGLTIDYREPCDPPLPDAEREAAGQLLADRSAS